MAQNEWECIYIIIFEIFGYVTFAFLLNVIWDYISEFRFDDLKYEKQLNIMNRYLKVKEIEPNLAMKVSAYLEYYLDEDKAREEEQEQQLINKLAPDIRRDLIFDANGYFLEYIPWIRKNFTIPFLRKLSEKIEEVKYLEKDLILDPRDLDEDDIALFYIEQGRVESFLDINGYGSSKGLPLDIYE
jgi:hypothetical protein